MSNKKKQGQKYQNATKFKLNDESKLTRRNKITPLDYLCKRCQDQIQWKMDFKKYKPLKQPGKCTECGKRNILKSYRVLCDPCALKTIHVRVPYDEAVKLGLVSTREEEEDQETQAKAKDEEQEDSKTVAE